MFLQWHSVLRIQLNLNIRKSVKSALVHLILDVCEKCVNWFCRFGTVLLESGANEKQISIKKKYFTVFERCRPNILFHAAWMMSSHRWYETKLWHTLRPIVLPTVGQHYNEGRERETDASWSLRLQHGYKTWDYANSSTKRAGRQCT